jgi:anti-sigma factor RsiW
MQHQESNPGTSSPVTHPDPGEWMEFIYQETPPGRRGELQAHLAVCPECSRQVSGWRASQTSLDDWQITLTRPMARYRLPVLRWAAAALLLVLGFVLGQRAASDAKQVAELKVAVARLADALSQERTANLTNAVNVATAAANTEAARLFSQYSLLQSEQRAADQQAFKLAFQALDTKVQKVQAAVETVALNTEESFQQTHQNLARLAFSLPVTKQPDALDRESK